MAGYGDEDEIIRQLQIDPGDTDAIARVESLNAELSAVFDAKVGRSWQGDGTPAMRVIIPASEQSVPWEWTAWLPFYPIHYPSDSPDLILPVPVRSVTQIDVGGVWNGADWDAAATLDPSDYRLVRPTGNGDYLGIRRELGSWWAWWTGPIRVTAVWADTDAGTVPVEVTGALTWLVTQHYRQEFMSPSGQIGPDGLTVRPVNPWVYSRVADVISRYALPSLVF